MDDATRTQVTLAAVAQATAQGKLIGDEGWEAAVATSAMVITALMSERSVVSRAMASLERCDQVFVARPVDATLEERSQRWVVTFEAKDPRTGETRQETLRTERRDDPLGQLVYGQLRACKGRPALIWKEVEDTGRVEDGHPVKVRMVRWAQPC